MNSEVALTKEEKLKKLNEKLNAMLKEKNCDPVIQKVLPTT